MITTNTTINSNINKSNHKVGSSNRKEVIDIRSDLIRIQEQIKVDLGSKSIHELMSVHCIDDANKAVLFVRWHKNNQNVKYKEFNKQYPNYYNKSTYSRMARYCNLIHKHSQLENIPESALRSLIAKLDKMPVETKLEILQQLTKFVNESEKLIAKNLKSKIVDLLKPYKSNTPKQTTFIKRFVNDLMSKTREEQITILSNILQTVQVKINELQPNPNLKNISTKETETIADRIQKLLKSQYADMREKQSTVNAISRELKLNDIDNYAGNPMNDNIALGWKLIKGELQPTEFAGVQNYDDVHAIAQKVLGLNKISSQKRKVA